MARRRGRFQPIDFAGIRREKDIVREDKQAHTLALLEAQNRSDLEIANITRGPRSPFGRQVESEIRADELLFPDVREFLREKIRGQGGGRVAAPRGLPARRVGDTLTNRPTTVPSHDRRPLPSPETGRDLFSLTPRGRGLVSRFRRGFAEDFPEGETNRFFDLLPSFSDLFGGR